MRRSRMYRSLFRFPLRRYQTYLSIIPPFRRPSHLAFAVQPGFSSASHTPSHSVQASGPRQFPTSGFTKLNVSEKYEEETVPNYTEENYYPVSIGQVFRSRYQVICKLGYGISSTVWLCRDLSGDRYLTLKVCTQSKREECEIAVSDHLKNFGIKHAGMKMVRLVLDDFEIKGPHGKHQCLLYEPLGMSHTDFLRLFPDKAFPKDLLQRSIQLLLLGLDYLHESGVIHTDISSNNVLQGIDDTSALARIEDSEINYPSARKVLDGRSIYSSRPMRINTGLPVLCDFGEARIGEKKHRGDIMPGIYRAPEVTLGMEWDEKVDIWSIGVMVWDLFEGGHLFLAKKNGMLNDEQHLAEMVSLMGPPPPEFLTRSEECRKYWDDQGNWKGTIPIPDQSFEMREWKLPDDDHKLFLAFLRRIFRWLPEERPVARDLATDEFLMQAILQDSE